MYVHSLCCYCLVVIHNIHTQHINIHTQHINIHSQCAASVHERSLCLLAYLAIRKLARAHLHTILENLPILENLVRAHCLLAYFC